MNITEYKPTERFKGLVETYRKYRPSYPTQIFDILNHRYGFDDKHITADIGSGTGIFTKLLVDNTNVVYAIEPNEEMRLAAEFEFSNANHFISIDGSAEQTKLDDKSVDYIFSAQAFHWFNYEKTIPEFYRIINADGKIVLIWNERSSSKGFMFGYENLLSKFCPDYNNVNHKNIDDKTIKSLFENKNIDCFNLDNSQELTFDQISGRVRSTSYCPKEDNPVFTELFTFLENMFTIYSEKGLVTFEYNTKVYVISE